jgi:uncharacterized protein YcnI
MPMVKLAHLPNLKRKVSSSIVLAALLLLIPSESAVAQVSVKPAEVLTNSVQTFVMGVPNEKNVATTSIRLLIPDGLSNILPTQKPGWQIDTEKSGDGASAEVKSITWSGSTIDPSMRDDFSFSAHLPSKAAAIQWKAYQTFADGTTQAWDQPENSAKKGSDTGPFTITQVVGETIANRNIANAYAAANDANGLATKALIAALIIGGIGVILAIVALLAAFRIKRHSRTGK